MAEPILCHNPACRKPMTFLADENNSFVFGCYQCGGARIITKPRAKAAARSIALARRRSQIESNLRANPRRTYLFLRS